MICKLSLSEKKNNIYLDISDSSYSSDISARSSYSI